MIIKPTPDTARHQDIPAQFPKPILKILVKAVQKVIDAYEAEEHLSASERANFEETPLRAAKAWYEINIQGSEVEQSFSFGDSEQLTSYVDQLRDETIASFGSKVEAFKEVRECLQTGFPMEHTDDPGMITQGPILATGLCPHHLLPVAYEIFVAYMPSPKGTVLGLSKIARIAIALAQRPVLQEQVGVDIAETFYAQNENDPRPQMESMGSAVQLIGSHSCMACRGVRSSALTLTTVLRGSFAGDSAKQEFYQAIESIRKSRIDVTGSPEDEGEDDDDPSAGDLDD